MIHLSDITKAVASHYRLDHHDLIGPSLLRLYAEPRFMAYGLCRELTRQSYPEIGRHFTRDHSTILSGERKHRKARALDADLHERYCRIRAAIKASGQVQFKSVRAE